MSVVSMAPHAKLSVTDDIDPRHDMLEPILREEAKDDWKQFVMYPIEDPETYAFFQKQYRLFWNPEAVILANDYKDFLTLSDAEQNALRVVHAFFASADGLVMKNISDNFLKRIKNKYILSAYTAQEFYEAMHADMYGQILKTIVPNRTEYMNLINSVANFPGIANLNRWALKWMNSNVSYPAKLVAFGMLEAIFYTLFAVIFKFKSTGKIKGIIAANSYIQRDEGLHVEFAAHIYNRKIHRKLQHETVHEIVGSCVEATNLYVDDVLAQPLPGLTRSMFRQYIRFIADYYLTMLNVPKLYNVVNPLGYMNMLSLGACKTNFHEDRPTEYAQPRASPENNGGIQFDEDF